MKPGDLMVTCYDLVHALVLDNGDLVGVAGGCPSIVVDTEVDVLDPHNNTARIIVNGMVGILPWHELEEPDETR
jgi:hypothetical protein